jgi:hypothetical protein
MNPTFSPTTFSVLNVYSLRTFHPDPEQGTLFGPSLETGTLNLPSRRITDGDSAVDLKLFSVLVLTEARDYWRLCSERGVERPYPIPGSDQKGTPWFLDEYQKSDDPGSHGRAVFRTPDPIRRVETDLRTPSYYRFAFTAESPDARFTQSIRVSDRDDSVQTDCFSAEIRGVSLENGWKLALGLSTAVYNSRQYDAKNELGALQFRQGDLGDWVQVFRKNRLFHAPSFDPDSHAALQFASSHLVFEDASASPGVPVVSLRLKPATLNTWDLEISLHRSPKSARRLTPLAANLRKILWNPIFARIFNR